MAETSKPSEFPDFENPPVIEVVCGVQFDEAASYHATTFGNFWQRVRHDYPTVEDKPPLASVFERSKLVPQALKAEITEGPIFPRVFLVHRNPNWLIQLQRDRFLHNWRKIEENDPYPRYPTVFAQFRHAWEQFEEFWVESEMGELNINQLEVTYINHIPFGEGWADLSEIGRVFRDLQWQGDLRFLPKPESLGWHMSFLLPEGFGRLHVSVKQGVRQRDNNQVLLCELTARGMPHASDSRALAAWFGMGREWIVRGFKDLTGACMHDHWGLGST